jgi:epoxyqueuosine reductase QueG
LQDFLAAVVACDPRNRLPEGCNIPIFEAPLVGIADAHDALFDDLRKPGVVGPIHVLPDYWLPGARSVISYFVPFSGEIKTAYVKGRRLPPLEWVSGRLNGEIFNNVLRRALLRLLQKLGAKAVIPNLDIRYKAENWLPKWSERHVGFVAGLGTFGLHAGLLTVKGTAGRMGSVVTNLVLPPVQRPYTGPYEYCPWKTKKRCGACMKACPVGAVTPGGKDHRVCVTNTAKYIRPAYSAWGYHGCGHCQNNLPCSDRLPAEAATRRKSL